MVPLTLPVKVQLVNNSNGICFESNFSTHEVEFEREVQGQESVMIGSARSVQRRGGVPSDRDAVPTATPIARTA